MVMIKSTSLVALLGSAALTSAAALPAARGEPESPSKRMWKGRLGARGPWRNENGNYLINVDLTGDGAHHNGHGSLIDVNTRSVLTPEQEDALRLHLKAHLQRSEPILSIADNEHHIGEDPLLDIEAAADLQARDERLLDLAAKVLVGSGEAAKRFPARDIDFGGLDAAAKSAGVTDEQMSAAKDAVNGLTADQRVQVENAVKHAMFAVTKPSEKRALPGPAYLRKSRSTEDVIAKLKEGGDVKVVGGQATVDTGVVSAETAEQHGAPLLAQPQAKRSVADEMGGAPGYIDITSPVFNSTAQRLASLVLSTSNGTNENSTFVLNASSSVRTQVFLVPLNSTETGEPEPKSGEPIKVNLKVPVFVAESAEVEPFCATFDPSPDAPEPMTVEPCSEPEDDRSQIFLFDPETGAVKPNWTPTEPADENKKLLAKVADSVSSEIPTSSSISASISATASAFSSSAVSAISQVSASLPSVSASASVTALPTASASDALVSAASAVEAVPSSSADLSLPSASDIASALPTEAASALPTDAASSIAAEPSDIASSVDALPTTSAIESFSAAAALPTASASDIPASASASASLVSPSGPVSASLAAPSASATPSAASKLLQVPVNAFASASASASGAIASASSATTTQKASAPGNNVNLIFTPSNASVQSTDDEEVLPAPVKSVKSKRSSDAEDCDEEIVDTLAATVPKPLASPVSPVTKPQTKVKAPAPKPKLPEGASHADGHSSKVQLTHGDVHIENVQGLARRKHVRDWKRQQQVMMVPKGVQDATAPYQWTWTAVEVAEKESQENAEVFAALVAEL